MPFILPTLLSFQGSTHLLGVGSFSILLIYFDYKTEYLQTYSSLILKGQRIIGRVWFRGA